ncbi:glycosyltransferase family 2 protein [Candidatus Magnetominusculus xianensis]|uniref:Glycosyl transferase family 2 n=1 Tax=Candidatus Magnetominusculus xianensis TaxID=1748249 RepID=A0ABR5SGN6_9BACT|nr:glycosyltransferase [Candidatus Magnetominusculus xianensis]KWT90143.1 glycosyl transferase family 2 [Candidatus Magnetominusculus xianensis]MBF0403637.1 glycosyltransferase [Nitrospirota bacterium]
MNEILPVSIIIPVGRDNTTLLNCLKSLNAMVDKPKEVILVGKHAAIELPASLNINLNIKFMTTEPAISPSVKRNRAAQTAQCGILCFIDDDVLVPENWISVIVEHLKGNPRDIVGGPNRDFRQDYRYRLPSAIQENYLTEGLVSHKNLQSNLRTVGIHDLPLCNVSMLRETFIDIGGFNEDITYFLDDVEFNYIAVNLGYRLVMLSALQVQHDIRPAFSPYFYYKYKTRYEIGKVFPLYYCLYTDTFQIMLVLLSYIAGPLLILYGGYKILLAFGIIYFIAVIVSSLKYVKEYKLFLSLPLGIFITHIMVYFGFTFGLIRGIFNWHNLQKLIIQKKERFKRFE